VLKKRYLLISAGFASEPLNLQTSYIKLHVFGIVKSLNAEFKAALAFWSTSKTVVPESRRDIH
jgi:hypothetical protein